MAPDNNTLWYKDAVFHGIDVATFSDGDFQGLCEVDPRLGTFDDFLQLVRKAGEKGIRIFPGEESSVWTYDEIVGQYYYHRFYHHEPDLDVAYPTCGKRSCT
jgi:glycosidase